MMSCESQCSVAFPLGANGWLECVIVVLPDHTILLFFWYVIEVRKLNKQTIKRAK